MRSYRLTHVIALFCCTVVAVGCGESENKDSGSARSAAEPTAPEVRFTGSHENGAPVGYPEPERAPLTIGMSTALRANETVRTIETAARLETERLGGRFIALDAAGNPDKQVSDFEQLISRKVDAIVTTPLDVRALAPVAKKAAKAGIPIFGQDMNVQGADPGPGFTGQVWQRRDYISYLQAREAARLMPEGGSFGQIGFIIKVPTLELAVERAAYWGEKFGLKPAGRADNKTDDIAGGEKAMTQLLGPNPDLAGLISYNEESATGAASAARAAGKKDLPIIGASGGSLGYSSVRSGRIDVTVQVQAPDVGRDLVRGAYGAVAGEKLPEAVVTGPPVVITKDNVDKVPTWETTLEERYGKSK